MTLQQSIWAGQGVETGWYVSQWAKELPWGGSIFTAEVCVIELALDIVIVSGLKSFLILSDSLCPVGFGGRGQVQQSNGYWRFAEDQHSEQGEKCDVVFGSLATWR